MSGGMVEWIDGEVKGRGRNFHIEHRDFQVLSHTKGV